VVVAPELGDLEKLKNALALDVELAQEAKPAFTIRLTCPKGEVTIRTP
jgi:hypothetical protein